MSAGSGGPCGWSSDHVLALLEAGDLAALAQAVASGSAAALDVDRCAVYLADPGTGRFSIVEAFPTAERDDAERLLRLGGRADETTRRIVDADGAIVIDAPDRRTGAPSSGGRRWGVAGLLVAPFRLDGRTVGFLVADDRGPGTAPPPDRLSTANTIARATTVAVRRLRETEQQAGDLVAERQRTRILQHTATLDRRLGATLLAAEGVDALLTTGSAALHRATALYDVSGTRVAEASDGDGSDRVRLLETEDDGVRTVLDDAEPGTCVTVPASLSAGVRRRHLAAPVDLGDVRWGWVVIAEHSSRFSVLDDRGLRRVAAHLALELTIQQRTALASLDARATLARLLIRGTHDSAETVRCATLLGIALDVPRVVAYVRDMRGRQPIDGEALRDGLRAAGFGNVLSTMGPEGIALMIEVPRDEAPMQSIEAVSAAMVRACRSIGGEGLTVGLSSICRDPHDLPRAYHEARDTARSARRAGDGGRVLAADHLGPARLFIANADPLPLDRFVADALGPLLGDDAHRDLLLTLNAMVDHGRSFRRAAVALGVHENTVRYRLARVHDLTGLDVAVDSHAQLTAQTALLVLRLRNHPALPALGTPMGPTPDTGAGTP